MATAAISVGSANLSVTSAGGYKYATTVNWTMPANSGITACTATFTLIGSSGTTQTRTFEINGTSADLAGWPNTGDAMNHSLIVTGANTFRVWIKAQAGYTCSWNISNITLNITYNEPYATKVWNGSSWVSGAPYVWNGSAWVPGVAYVWNGSAWVPGLT